MKKKTTEEQSKSSRTAHLAPWQYRKGQSGNPKGRPEGISLKEYARIKFRKMTDEERENFFEGMDKKTLWEMAEGKPDTKSTVEATVEVNSLKELTNEQLINLATASTGGTGEEGTSEA